MVKNILTAIIMLSLLFTLGCDKTAEQTKPSSSMGLETIRTAELASKWQMNQMRIEGAAGDKLLLLLKLASGDKVDGYFYLEQGKDVGFDITGNSLLYQSKAQGALNQVTSDRFTFTASQAQGTTYTLTFQNNADTKLTIFLELIYPATSSIYVPIKIE